MQGHAARRFVSVFTMDDSQLPTEGASTVAELQPEEQSQQQQQQQPTAAPEQTADQPASTTGETAAHSHGGSIDTRGHHAASSHDFPSSIPDYSHPESDQLSRFNSSPTVNYHPQNQGASRPGSGLSGAGDKYISAQPFTESGQKSSVPASRNSVVIKVGMVGDAQIGKTSLMVKYVEGSWDEDYIQTLGESSNRQDTDE